MTGVERREGGDDRRHGVVVIIWCCIFHRYCTIFGPPNFHICVTVGANKSIRVSRYLGPSQYQLLRWHKYRLHDERNGA